MPTSHLPPPFTAAGLARAAALKKPTLNPYSPATTAEYLFGDPVTGDQWPFTAKATREQFSQDIAHTDTSGYSVCTRTFSDGSTESFYKSGDAWVQI